MSNGPQHMSLFSQLVAMLTTSAFQQMGKLANPMTGKAEVDLEGAQASIDMLDMLEEKSRGNLDPDEEKGLSEALTALRLNFVQARQGGGQREAPSAPAEPAPTAAETTERAPAPDTTKSSGVEQPKEQPGDDPSKTRYHKTYG